MSNLSALGNIVNAARRHLRQALGSPRFGDIVFRLLNNMNDRSIKSVEVTITTAEILALFATPIEIVAAPGANKYLEFVGLQAGMKYAGVAYAGIAAGEDWVVKQTNAAGAQVSGHIETTAFLDATSDQRRHVGPARAAAVTVSDFTPAVNAALVLHQLIAEIITGTSDVKLVVYYRVIDVVDIS